MIRKILMGIPIIAMVAAAAFVFGGNNTTSGFGSNELQDYPTQYEYLRLQGENYYNYKHYPTDSIGFRRTDNVDYWCFNTNSVEVYTGGPEVGDLIEDMAKAWETSSNIVEIYREFDCDRDVPDPQNDGSECGDSDGQNVVTIVNNRLPDHTYGLTCINLFDGAMVNRWTGEMKDVDIVLDYANLLEDLGSGVSLQEMALHEFGHFWGLGHFSTEDYGPLNDNNGQPYTEYAFACPGVSVMCTPNTTGNASLTCWVVSNCLTPTLYDFQGLLNIYHDNDGDGCIGSEEDFMTHKYEPSWNIPLSDANFQDWMDITGDQQVNSIDLSQEVQAFGAYPGPPIKDFPTNGQVNSLDLQRMAQQMLVPNPKYGQEGEPERISGVWRCWTWSRGLPVLQD